jgi:hypothetical protein
MKTVKTKNLNKNAAMATPNSFDNFSGVYASDDKELSRGNIENRSVSRVRNRAIWKEQCYYSDVIY